MKRVITIAAALLAVCTFSLKAQTQYKETVDSLISVAPAYNEYNTVRRGLFAQLPVTPDNIVFMGDSITDRCEWDELLENQDIINRGISGDRTVWMFDRYEMIAEGHPRKLFIMCGVNDLNSGRTKSHDTVIMIAELLTRFHAISPETEIYFQSILPMNLNAPARERERGSTINQRIENCDVWLAKWMKDKKWVTYVDVASALKDSEGMLNEAYTVDGLHLNGIGYLVWKDVIYGFVND